MHEIISASGISASARLGTFFKHNNTVWWCDVATVPSAVYNPEFWQNRLNAAERQRALRLCHKRVCHQYVLSRIIVRQILSAQLCIAAAHIPIALSHRGKPYLDLPGHELYFNLSHSRDRIVFAVSVGAEIGVDVEWLRPLPKWQALANRFFAPEEVLALHSVAPNQQQQAFLRLWTHKEAYLKALGWGLSYSLKAFAIQTDGISSRLIYDRKAEDSSVQWQLFPLSIAGGYTAALASQHADPPQLRQVFVS